MEDGERSDAIPYSNPGSDLMRDQRDQMEDGERSDAIPHNNPGSDLSHPVCGYTMLNHKRGGASPPLWA